MVELARGRVYQADMKRGGALPDVCCVDHV